jgi:hypothetical protein
MLKTSAVSPFSAQRLGERAFLFVPLAKSKNLLEKKEHGRKRRSAPNKGSSHTSMWVVRL